MDGAAYFFVARERFLSAVAAGELLEWAEYSGHLYGTPRAQVEGPLAAGEDVLLDIEMRGAEQVKAAFPEAVFVFVAPPSLRVLEQRLRGRGDTGDEQVARRLGVAREQMEQARAWFDHIVVNDDLERAIGEVAGILSSPTPPGSTS